jgi:cytochrome c553
MSSALLGSPGGGSLEGYVCSFDRRASHRQRCRRTSLVDACGRTITPVRRWLRPRTIDALFTDGRTSQFTLEDPHRIGPADWYPGDCPSAAGRRARLEAAGIWACSLCHYPNGKGRPEHASVVGLPTEYFVRQMYDFKNGLRESADSRKPNTPIMASFAVQMTDEEIQQAAEYFSSMRWTPWIQVVETDTVPKTRIAGGMHLKLDGAEAGTEPLGLRIVNAGHYTRSPARPALGLHRLRAQRVGRARQGARALRQRRRDRVHGLPRQRSQRLGHRAGLARP